MASEAEVHALLQEASRLSNLIEATLGKHPAWYAQNRVLHILWDVAPSSAEAR
jgi:hypothetical protein